MGSWMKVKLTQVCSSISDGDHLPPPKCESGVPFVTISDIKNNRFDLANTRFVPKAYFDAIDEKRRIRKGDVLYSVVGSYGIPVYADKDLDIAFQRHIAILKPGKDVDSRYLYYSLLNPAFYNAADNVAIGAAQKTITLSALRNLEIPLPPLPVQRRIADILSAYDDLIENNRRRIAILEETARLAYRKWFGGEVGCNDTVGKVSDFFDISIGRTPPRKSEECFSHDLSDVKWLSIKDMKADRVFAFDSSERLTGLGVEKTKIHISPPGTIFLSFKLTVGVVVIAGDYMATNEAIAHFETNDRALRDYTYFYLSLFQYDKLGSTSAIAKAINSDIVRKMDFVLPDRASLDRYEKEVAPMFDQIENLTRQSAALAAARDKLLPRLMKGDVA